MCILIGVCVDWGVCTCVSFRKLCESFIRKLCLCVIQLWFVCGLRVVRSGLGRVSIKWSVVVLFGIGDIDESERLRAAGLLLLVSCWWWVVDESGMLW